MENSGTLQAVLGFKGLNNRVDPTRLGWEFALQVDNCLCDNAGYLVRRPGLSEVSALNYKDIYGTHDGRLLAIDANDQLIEVDPAGNSTVLHTGITGAPFQWAELGYAIFLMSGTALWAVYPNQAIVWGSLCPAADTTEYPLADPISYPPPAGSVLGVRRSQLVIGVYEAERNRSVLYFSRPDYPHEFRLDRDWQIIPGKITLLATVSQGVLIATDQAIYFDPVDAPLMRVAEYGVNEGGMVFDDRDLAWFWSERGLCKAAPFANVTDESLVVTSRKVTTAAVLPWQGSTYAVVQQTGPVVTRRVAQPYETLPTASAFRREDGGRWVLESSSDYWLLES